MDALLQNDVTIEADKQQLQSKATSEENSVMRLLITGSQQNLASTEFSYQQIWHQRNYSLVGFLSLPELRREQSGSLCHHSSSQYELERWKSVIVPVRYGKRGSLSKAYPRQGLKLFN